MLYNSPKKGGFMSTIYKIIKTNKNKLINEDYCTQCKGECCKQSSCGYLPADLDMSKKGIIKKLEEGNTSINANVYLSNVGNKIISVPILSLSVKQIGKETIDLLSPHTSCSMLGENGCLNASKPSGALLLMPNSGGISATNETRCKSLLEDHQILAYLEWAKHEKVLLDVIESISNEKFDMLYIKALLTTAKSILDNIDNLQPNEEVLKILLSHLGIMEYLNNFSIDSMIEEPTINNLNLLYPNKKLLKTLSRR